MPKLNEKWVAAWAAGTNRNANAVVNVATIAIRFIMTPPRIL
jgi:hypothetical protein